VKIPACPRADFKEINKNFKKSGGNTLPGYRGYFLLRDIKLYRYLIVEGKS